MSGTLILARHHESEWNKLGKWTGKTDIPLTPYGIEKSKDMGLLVKDLGLEIHEAYASTKVRTIETLSCILGVCEQHEVPTVRAAELDERDYGVYTGKNKWEMQQLLGDDEFKKLRRSWDYMIPEGESLKMVYERAVPYFLTTILPRLRAGKNVLIVAHGNSLRTIIKYIESIPDDKIADFEVPFGAVMVYDIDIDGHMVGKKIQATESSVPA